MCKPPLLVKASAVCPQHHHSASSRYTMIIGALHLGLTVTNRTMLGSSDLLAE